MMGRQCVILLFAVMCLLVVNAEQQRALVRPHTLFEDTAYVVDLTSMSQLASSHPMGLRCPWVIMFYSHECGHCRAAAPHYASFAKSIYHLWDGDALHGLVMGAVNCRENTQTCTAQNVSDYPSFILFYPRALAKEEGRSAPSADGDILRKVLPVSSQDFGRAVAEVRRTLAAPRSPNGQWTKTCAGVREDLRKAKTGTRLQFRRRPRFAS